ncbi:hypothetical protein AGMMS49938_13190 [Fibrobacterales bacterium]|nr:hypothetical protein AGMMS49938_13190 [Fibrobacterales bacterium]
MPSAENGGSSVEDSLLFDFAVSKKQFVPGDSVSISLKLGGQSETGWHARIYAQDSKGNSIFDISADTIGNF